MKKILGILLILTLIFPTLLFSADGRLSPVLLLWEFHNPPEDHVGYYINIGTQPGQYFISTAVSKEGLTYRVPRLPGDDIYYFSVSAHYSNGDVSQNSNEVSADITFGETIERPAPTNLKITVVPMDDGSVAVVITDG